MTPDLEPRQLSKPDILPAVWGVLETPPKPGNHAGVILLPGSSGWQPAYAQVARTLADSGLVALAIDYYSETGSATSPEDELQKWPLWQATVRNAVAYLQASPWISVRKVGLVGYSLGAFLAVSVAARLPGVMAVVDFFGGGGMATATLDQEAHAFPPLLILHGDGDTVVPVEKAYRLRQAVLAHGGVVEMYIYPGAQHAFNAPWSPMYSEPEAADSLNRMIEFLRRRLGE